MTYQEYKNYFSGLDAHQDINSVVVGTVDDLLHECKLYKANDYPVLFVPPLSTQNNLENDNPIGDYTGMVTIYKPFPKNAKQSEKDSILIELETIINDVAAKIITDIEEEIFPIDTTMDLRSQGPGISEPLGSPRLIGWVWEFSFKAVSPIRHNAAKWN